MATFPSKMPSKDILKTPQAIFFDLDGTLIDSAPDLGAAADKLRTDRGLPSIAYARYRPLAGAGARGMLSVAFDMQPDHPEFESLREEFYVNYERSLTERTIAFDGVHQLLDAIRARRIAWGIVTNKSKRFTHPLVAQMPLLQGAAAVISGDSTPHTKPHPEPVLAAARAAGVQPEHCWYVGDDKRDVQSGRAAGMFTVAAQWGYLGEHAVDSWGADALAAQPADLLRWLGWV
jgi:N-acetyl-D-muramate 6-phosphate phosphatase